MADWTSSAPSRMMLGQLLPPGMIPLWEPPRMLVRPPERPGFVRQRPAQGYAPGSSSGVQYGYVLPMSRPPAAPFYSSNVAPVPIFPLNFVGHSDAPPDVEKMPENDLQEAVSWLTKLCTKTENILREVQKMVNIQDPSSTSMLVSCPFDSRHTMPAHALLQHSLRCPSSPAGLNNEAVTLVASLTYLQKHRKGVHSTEKVSTEEEMNADSKAFDPSVGQFWYDGAPAPFQGGYYSFTQDAELFPGLPACIKAELEQTCGLPRTREFDRFLPSECWLLRKEVEGWTCLPGSCSWNILRSAMEIDRIDKDKTIEWLLVTSVHHGIVLDPVLASHIFVLVRLFLAAVRREAASTFNLSTNSGNSACKVGLVKCPVLLESGNWLISQLASLYQHPHSRDFILELLKHSLIVSACSLQRIPFSREVGAQCEAPTEQRAEEIEVKGMDVQPGLVQVESAIQALHERKKLEIYVNTRVHINNLTRARYVEEHDTLVTKAAEERLHRHYTPILEHDGLIWHRQQGQDSSKIKTKEEMLAEERDYKRRRTSYRGKKVRRTTTQVLHDIIEKHMEEIVVAGGIGCFEKQSAELSCMLESGHKGDIAGSKSNQSDRTHRKRDSRGRTEENESYRGSSILNETSAERNGYFGSGGRPPSRHEHSSSHRYEIRHEPDVRRDDSSYKRESKRNSEEGSDKYVRSHDRYRSGRQRSASRDRWESEVDEYDSPTVEHPSSKTKHRRR